MLSILAAAAAVALPVVAGLYVRNRFLFWQEHASHMHESGYLVPPSTLPARITWRALTRLCVFLFVGPLKVVGTKNLKVNGRKIFAPNHQFEFDFAMTAAATRTACPIMTSAAVLKPKAASLIGAWTGSIPVDVEQESGGKKAYDASVQTLLRKRDAEFVIFPQGALLEQLKLGDFKPGVARMQEEVWQATSGEPVWIFPMYIAYVRDRQYKPLSHRVLGRLRRAFGKVNYGGLVCIGKPIAYDPARTAEETTALILAQIVYMQQQANRNAKYRRH